MAELYAKPYEVIDTGYNPQQTQQGSQDAEMQSYLDSLPPEERQKAIERINAPLTGEELALMAKSGERLPTLEDYAEIEKFHKNHEVSFIDGLGRIAEGGEQVMNDIVNAATSFWSNPADATSKMPATAVEAFAQGTRNFYGMLAQSQNPDSALFRVKDFLNGTGTIEDRYNQYIEALKFNKQSADLAEGKQTLVMDKDMINHEVTQAMAYIADPTLFIPFGKVASTGLRAVGLGEKLALAGARSAAIKNGIIGNTIKWGAGQPLEFLGGAVRNTIDYGLERAGAAFEATTGVGAKEFAQTARMSGIGFSASAVAGHAVPYASTISDAYLVGSSARGFGEALTLLGDTMKKNQFGRGINSWAAESLAQAEKNGVALSPHAKGLLKTLNAVDPLFAYGWNGLEGAAEGALIGGGLGYLSDGAEGMYSGIGAGIALGGVGATAGKVVADVTGGTNVARRAVQAKMVIEGHKVTNPEKAMFFQAMQKAAEVSGKDVDLVNGIIAGIDNVAPNFEFHALTPDQFKIEAEKRGYNPDTGKFMETSALDVEFGGDRASKSKAMYVLRSVGGDFVGNRQGFLDALKKASAKDSANPNKPASNIPLNLRKYIDVAKTFEKLSKTQQEAILKEIDGQTAKSTELGGKTKLREYYDALTWSEAWTDSIVKKFESDREGARKDIAEMLAQETDKNGKLNSKGRALADKLRAEGFLDKDNKLLRERNLLNADLTLSEFRYSKGAVIGREADGKTHMYINLSRMGDETFPHELFHTIMRESPMKKHFTDTLIHKLLGTVDKDGNLVRPAEVNLGQVTKFFKKYIDLTHRNDDGTLNAKAADERFKQVQEALAEYQNAGENKKISDKARSLIENYTEEFGAYYFSHWLMGRNRNTLFFGGELKGVEGLVERAKDSFKDFWQSKISKSNPEFDFSRGLNEAFDRSKGLGRISAMDYYMRDMVRAASNANKEVFRPDSMTLENLRDFERSNGLRNLTTPEGTRRLNPREQVTQNIRLGKEAYKILSGLDKNLRTSKDVLDENGKQIITGRLSEAELDALVKGGIVPRAWADKVNQGYAMLDGTVSNIFSAGYLGKTEQTTDASYPRLTGKDVSFKNRKAVLFDVETKIKADGTFYTLFHTLDLAVIEQRGNHLWQNVDYRNLWNGDRAAFEADFFRYISNASKASTDPKKLDSATLFETGDGNGAKRRDVMHQMAGMALQTGDAYKHQPIAVIPEGIRHSVTTFNIDGMTMPRIETGTRYDINMGNAHKFIRENWQPAEMKQEKTPAGTLFTHETGFKFSAINGKYSAYTNDGSKIGTYGTIREATFAAKNLYNKAQENITKIANDFKQKEEQNRKNLQPLDEATYEEAFRIGDMFKTKRMQEIIGDSKLVRQTFDEFRDQKVEEIISGKNEQEKGAILNQLFSSEFKELIDLEAELKKTYDEFGLEARQVQEQETEITKKIVELSQEKQRLQESGNPEAKVDIGILDMYGRIYKRKQEVNKRLSEIASKMHNEGITDLNSHYYITKRFLQNFNETGKLSEEAVKFAITPRLIKAYEANFETGKAVTFLANHGTPNHELMVSKTFDMGFLGRNTGSMSAFNATFFAGSKETSVNYVGNPIEKTWVRDFIQARKYYVKNFSPEIKAKLESLLSSDTSKGVVQKVSALMANAHIEFPDDFKLKDTGRKTKEGEPIIKPQPETQLGYDIDGFLDRALEGANDEGFSIGGYEMAWNEEGKKPHLLRNIVKMENPYVHEYAKADYRDETFASVIRRAKEAGHDGVIFKNTKDGGGLDTIFASFAKNEDNKIFTLETTEDTRFAPRGTDEAGNKVKNGSEIEGRNYQPTEIPEKRGTVKIKEGYTRVYHQTTADNIESIKRNGLLVSKSRPSSESRGVSVSETPFYGNNPDLVTIELQVPTEKLKQANGSALLEDVPASNIIAVHEDWHDKARYILNNPSSLKEVLNGDMDFFLGDGSPEAKAIEYIKNKYKNNRANLQPSEDIYSGGREYDFNSKQFKSGFVGLYAAENPDRVKGISLQFMKRADGSHRIRLTDNSKKGESADIGHITANIDGDRATLSSHINEAYRGNKLSYVVYSEMAERLRAMGVTAVDGQIVNPDGIPIKVRERIIGDTRDLYSGRRINYVEGANRIRDKQELVGSMGGVDVTNTLYKQGRYMPSEGTNAPVNKENRNFILNNIKANANSLRAFEEGQKSPEERNQNYITIDNINPDLLRGEAVVMHSPDNAGVEPVQIGRFTVHPRGGMRYPSENPTQGWAGVKAGLGKQINDNGNYNAEKGYGWSSAVGLIKGENSKMKGTHIGLEVFLRNLQNFTDNNVLTEKQTIQILKNGLGDIGDTKRPLDAIVEDILAKSAKHEGKYTIEGRRKAIEKMTKTDGSASLWKYLQSNLTSIEPHIKGFSSEGVTNANQFIKAILEPMYEAVADPLTRHAKVGEVYGYLVFRSPVEEPKSNIHPSYKYSVQPVKGGSPVQLDILSTPMNARNAFTNRITAGKVSPLPVSEKGFAVSTGQKHIPTMRGTFMPAEVHGITPSEGFKWFKRNKFKNIPHEREIQIDNILNDVLENGLSYNEAAQKNNDTFKNVYRIVSNYVSDNPSALKLTPAERVKSYNYKWFVPLDEDAKTRVPLSKAIKIDTALDDIANKRLDIETASKKYQIPRGTLEAYIGKARKSEKGFPYFLQGINSSERDADPYVFNESTKRLKVSDENKKLMLSMYEDEGLSVENEIAPQFGISPNMIYKFIREQKDLRDKKSSMQPAEYTEFKSEQSPLGRIMRNAKGYVITMANNKFRVYNPAKAIIGVYGSEEEAKKRIYREIPKQ